MTKPIMEEALDEVRRTGRLSIQERVFAKMKPHGGQVMAVEPDDGWERDAIL